MLNKKYTFKELFCGGGSMKKGVKDFNEGDGVYVIELEQPFKNWYGTLVKKGEKFSDIENEDGKIISVRNSEISKSESMQTGGMMKDGGNIPKYTKGEWELAQRTPNTWQINSDSKISELARIFADPTRGNGKEISHYEARGNARLMTASKEMYEALKDYVELYKNNPSAQELTKRGEEALKKAEGKYI